MINPTGKRVCDKEVRKRGGAARWGGCRKPACVSVPSKAGAYDLDYCQHHAPTARLRAQARQAGA